MSLKGFSLFWKGVCSKNRLFVSLEEYLVILEKVRAILSEQFDVYGEEITEETNIEKDFNADSLDIADLLIAFEEEFNIKIPDEISEDIKTVGDMVSYIKKVSK
jgi:acyl carrier protein